MFVSLLRLVHAIRLIGADSAPDTCDLVDLLTKVLSLATFVVKSHASVGTSEQAFKK